MRRRTSMPVVFQPEDSGFNSHLRGSERRNHGEEGHMKALPVPFVRILYEREVATLGMPHLKSFDLELQVRKGLFGLVFLFCVCFGLREEDMEDILGLELYYPVTGIWLNNKLWPRKSSTVLNAFFLQGRF